MEARKQEEIAFHDRLRESLNEQRWSPQAESRVAADPLWANFKYYAIEHHSLELAKRWQLEKARGAAVLDYCCGNGDDAVFIAKQGARSVVGIDISPVSIQNGKALAAHAGVADRVDFRVMDAEALEFAADSFDLITEYGVLHHLDLERAMSELARVLRSDGIVVCTETLAHNPLIAAYRRRTPHLRTAWEVDHILGRRSFQTIERHFATVERRFFHLATLGAVPLRNTPLFTPVLAGLRVLDRVLLSIPGLQWQAWQVVFKLSNPRKGTR